MKVNFANSSDLLGEAIVFRTESESRPGVFHYTIKLRDGGIVCSCEGWQFAGHCKHVMNLNMDTDAIREIMRRWHKHE